MEWSKKRRTKSYELIQSFVLKSWKLLIKTFDKTLIEIPIMWVDNFFASLLKTARTTTLHADSLATQCNPSGSGKKKVSLYTVISRAAASDITTIMEKIRTEVPNAANYITGM